MAIDNEKPSLIRKISDHKDFIRIYGQKNNKMNQNRIDSFFGEYRFLSNFWPHPVKFENKFYFSVENAYQAAKTLDLKERVQFMDCESGTAKKLGRKIKLRDDWETVKVPIMRQLLVQKFSDPTLRERLLATGDMILIEGNTWGDYFWGVCKGEGRNMLGLLLMAIRDELRN